MSSGMQDGESDANGSSLSKGSIGVASVDAFEELDEDSEGVIEIFGGIVNDGLGDVEGASRESMRRMSSTSEEPRGVLGGGKGLVTDPDRARPDIKLRRRSRFFVLLAGDDDASSRAI